MDKEPMIGNNDIAKFISETHRGLHRQRQPYEFKVVFTVLSFYVLSTATVLSEKLNPQALQSLSIFIWIFFMGVAGMATIYLYRLHAANRTNICMAENAERILITQIENEDNPQIYVKPSHRNYNRKSPDPMTYEANWLCQSALIFIFALATAFIITSNAASSNDGDKSHQKPNKQIHADGGMSAHFDKSTFQACRIINADI